MFKLKIQESKITPLVEFKNNSKELFIKGKSIPEHPKSWYNELRQQISPQIKSKTIEQLNFYLDYFNTASAKEIYTFIKECIDQNDRIRIIWTYETDDDDMLEAGKDYEIMSGIKFTFSELS